MTARDFVFAGTSNNSLNFVLFLTAAYGRLSQEDEREGESNSIQNQRLMLEKYATENGFENTLFFSDDGYSGTNFQRPSWLKVMKLIENGEVGTIIVKDMSRLGREYLQVGQLTELIFPSYGVRFIAIQDNVDSLYGENDFAPFKNLFNDFFAKDTSRKIRAVKKAQAERGERIATRAPYGYKVPHQKQTILISLNIRLLKLYGNSEL